MGVTVLLTYVTCVYTSGWPEWRAVPFFTERSSNKHLFLINYSV